MRNVLMSMQTKRFLGIVLAIAMTLTSGNWFQVFAEALPAEVTESITENDISESVETENAMITALDGSETISEDTVSGSDVVDEKGETDSSLFTLSVNKVEVKAITLKWNDNTYNPKRYNVYRRVSSLNGSQDFDLIKSLKPNVRKFKDGGLQYNTTYEYYIEVIDKINDTPLISDIVSAKTSVTAPAEKNTKAVLTKKNYVKLTWAAVTGAKFYKIERRKSNGEWELLGEVMTKHFNDKKISDSYIYRISGGRRVPDGSIVYGDGTVVVCTPTILSAAAYGSKDVMGVEFSKTKGATSYMVKRAYRVSKAYSELPDMTGADAQNTHKYFGNVVTALNGVDAVRYLDDGHNKNGGFEDFQFGEYYYYKVYAQAQVDGKLVTSKGSTAKKARVAMNAPRFASVSSNSGSTVTFTWEEQKDITGNNYYQIWRSKNGLSNYTKVKAVKPDKATRVDGSKVGVSYNCLQYTLSNVPAEAMYYYKISSVINKVQGAKSEAKGIKTQLNDLESLTVKSANFNAMELTFKKVDGAKYYQILMAQNIVGADGKLLPEDQWYYAPVAKCTASANKITKMITYKKTGLKHGRYYAFKVRPATKNGVHVHRKQYGVEEPYGYDYTKLKAPTLKAAAQSLSKIQVTWSDCGKSAERYIVESCENDKFAGETYYRRVVSKGTTYYTKRYLNFDGLTPGKHYFYRVSAVKKDSNLPGGELQGAYSNVVEEWPRPAAPENVATTGHTANEGADVSWTKITGTGSEYIEYYTIERSMGDSDGSYDNWVTLNPNDSKTSKSYKSTNGVFHFYDKSVIADGTLMKYRVSGWYYNEKVSKNRIQGRPAGSRFCNPSAIKLNTTSTSVGIGQTKTLKVEKFTPEQTTAKHISWYSSNTNYVTVSSKGVIKGIKKTKDNTYITVTAETDNGIKATCRVKVTEAVAEEGGGKVKVCLDPGHGGSNNGANYNGWREQDATLIIANACKDRLLNDYKNATVVMTRTGDSTVDNAYRADMAKNQGCDVLVSIHLNAGGGKGTEVLLSGKASDKKEGLASKIISYNQNYFGLKNRGLETRSDLAVLNRAATLGVPAILVEEFFMDGDASFLSSEKMKQIGQANADAIASYYGLERK